MAIDNLSYYVKNIPNELPEYLKETWGRSLVYSNKLDALEKADEYESNYGTEYGIRTIMLDIVFPQ